MENRQVSNFRIMVFKLHHGCVIKLSKRELQITIKQIKSIKISNVLKFPMYYNINIKIFNQFYFYKFYVNNIRYCIKQYVYTFEYYVVNIYNIDFSYIPILLSPI